MSWFNLSKHKLTLKERIKIFFRAFTWLYEPIYSITEKRYIKPTWQERRDCFFAEIETAVIGYVYK